MNDTIDSNRCVGDSLIRKLHLHLPRGYPSVIFRILDMAKRRYTRAQVESEISKCGRLPQHLKISRPMIQGYIPPFAGHSLCMDVFYPLPQELQGARKHPSPFLLIARTLSRFVVIRPIRNFLPCTAGEELVAGWFMYYGEAPKLLCDKGPGFIGPFWALFCSTWSCVMLHIPTDASHANGLIERQVDLVKTGFLRAPPHVCQ